MCACGWEVRAGLCAGTPHSSNFFALLAAAYTATDTTTMRVWTAATHVS